jgi:glycine betaine transporter
LVGAVSLIFITTLGIDGIRMLSCLGGFPALFLGILSIASLIFIMGNPKKFDTYSIKEAELTNKE